MDCLVLAGGTPKPGDSLYEETGGRPKALIDLDGRPLVQWVVEALDEADSIDRIVLVGLEAESSPTSAKPLVRIPGGGSWSDNFFAGAQWMVANPTADPWAAYCASDVPLISGEMVDRFLARAGGDDLDVRAGLVHRDVLERRFPQVRESYLRLREGPCVAADVAAFRPSEAARVRGELEELAPRRKSAWRQAAKVGPGFVLRYLLGRLSVPALESRLARAFAVRAHIDLVDDPELGLDVDGPVNLAICRSAVA